MSSDAPFYLLWCSDCHYPIEGPLPFDDPGDRWEWATSHVNGTGHTRLVMMEQPSPFEGGVSNEQ